MADFFGYKTDIQGSPTPPKGGQPGADINPLGRNFDPTTYPGNPGGHSGEAIAPYGPNTPPLSQVSDAVKSGL